nr:hypothetical protein [Tanacetum cinerariifolium]
MAELQFRMCKDDSSKVMRLIQENGKATETACTAKKRVKGVEWFKEKMLLAQAQEAGVILEEEQQEFTANGLEEFDPDCLVNGDDVSPTYDLDILSEVPHYDTYHENDMIIPVFQET